MGQEGVWFSCGFFTQFLIHTYCHFIHINHDIPCGLRVKSPRKAGSRSLRLGFQTGILPCVWAFRGVKEGTADCAGSEMKLQLALSTDRPGSDTLWVHHPELWGPGGLF